MNVQQQPSKASQQLLQLTKLSSSPDQPSTKDSGAPFITAQAANQLGQLSKQLLQPLNKQIHSSQNSLMNSGVIKSSQRKTPDPSDDGGKHNQQQYISESLLELENFKLQLTSTVEDLDSKLGRVITKQEYQYLQTYNRFVEEQTRHLNELVDKLNEKSSNRTAKDIKIGELQSIIERLREDAAKSEELNQQRLEDVKKLQTKLEHLQSDRKFLYMHAREEKQKSMNLQNEVEDLKRELEETKKKLASQENINREINLRILKELTLGNGSTDETLINKYKTSNPYEEKSQLNESKIEDTDNIKSRRQHKSQSRNDQMKEIIGKRSFYCPFTQNKKFELFLEDLFDLGFDLERNKKEIIFYVQAIEAYYSEKA